MGRILNLETNKSAGKQVKVAGWVQTIRAHGKIVFFDLRDRSGLLQIVFVPGSPAYEKMKKVKPEWVVEITGIIKKRPEKMVNDNIETGKVEMEAKEMKVLAESDPIPFDYLEKDLQVSLPTLLDQRPLTVRNEKVKAAFKLGDEITDSFRKTLKAMDFTEFQSPCIVPNVAEGGAEIFEINYYKHKAYLSQSPQLYKQIMLGAFERVFTIAHIFRAEPSVTTRHLSEYVSLDTEMAFIESWEEIMDVCEKIIKNMVENAQKNCKKELELYGVEKPKIGRIPRIKMKEAQKIIFQRTKKDQRKEPDLDPEDEKEISKWALEKHKSDFVFITHYPTKKRPFYTYPDPKDKDYTLSFDLLFRGLEIVTGGQRINNYKQLTDNIKKWGNDLNNFSFYLQAFKYGLPPEGGFAMGQERIVKQFLGLANLREATPFPRDMERIDQRLSLTKKKKNRK
ncbi:MAG: aspartate--tRNA(Asn) ligase [bacterium]